MKHLLSSLVFSTLCSLSSPCPLSSWGVSSTNQFVVDQSSNQSVTEGETAHLSCCWNSWNASRKAKRVEWLIIQTQNKGGTMVKPEVRVVNVTCSNLTLPNIMRNDSGTYTCKVTDDKPYLLVSCGNGTVVTVEARHNTSMEEGVNLPLVIPLVVVALLVLLTPLCLWMLWRRQGSGRAARVIYEVPHQDSDSSRSSRGSSQWCEVPVYESFDYFEHVEDVPTEKKSNSSKREQE